MKTKIAFLALAALGLLAQSFHIEIRNGLLPEQADLFAGPAMGGP